MISENSLNPVVINEIDIVKIPKDIPKYDTEDYDFFDDKDKAKYIKDLERFVRNSIEYRQMVGYLREYMNMTQCAFMPQVNNETSFKIRIEIHHSPITLYDICSIILQKRMSMGENLNIEQVAFEVLYVHYCLMVGLIPLSETVHELVHNQYIFVPLDKIYGYYRTFLNTYKAWVPEEIEYKMKQLEQLTENYNMATVNQVLEKKFIQVDMEGNNQIEQLHQVKTMLQDKLNEYKSDTQSSYNIERPDNYNQDRIVVPAFVKVS